MTNFLRRLSRTSLVALAFGVIAVVAAGTAIAASLTAPGQPPPPKPLAQAVHDALSAPPVQGVTARITFTNHVVSASGMPGGRSPLMSGATGRLWVGSDGRMRLELQSDQGDAQITSDGKVLSVFDASSNTDYRIALPQRSGHPSGNETHTPPTVQAIQTTLARVAQFVDVSGATPSVVAGRGAYTVRVTPKGNGGLVGAAEFAWDAATGTPLRAAVFAAGQSSPVLELAVTDISFGPVPASDLNVTPPSGARVVDVRLPMHAAVAARAHHQKPVTGVSAVSARLPFKLSAPDTLAGMSRTNVRLIGNGARSGAVVTYGTGLGGLAVFEFAHQPGPNAGTGQSPLPPVSINGNPGQELVTALGTVVRFQRGGVEYTVVGSVTQSVAEAAARGL
jgi:outer membrane lipoprotein-sorting protein